MNLLSAIQIPKKKSHNSKQARQIRCSQIHYLTTRKADFGWET